MPRGVYSHPRRRPQPRWILTLKIGDVVQRQNGQPRIVRKIWRHNDGTLSGIVVAIQRCSWTHRCYTILNHTDLRTFGYRKLRKMRAALDADFDRMFDAAVHQPSAERPYVFDCCDVKGIP